MSNTKCCVAGCENNSGSSETLHKFPNPKKNNALFNSWVYSVGGNILGLENDHIFKYRRVCHKHFEDKYLCRNNRISIIAIPTLHMPGPTSLPKFTLIEKNRQSADPVSKDPSTSAATQPDSGKLEHMTMKENIGCWLNCCGDRVRPRHQQCELSEVADSRDSRGSFKKGTRATRKLFLN
ncbi:unnamed protein product, partial [Iphiclides podalirius]